MQGTFSTLRVVLAAALLALAGLAACSGEDPVQGEAVAGAAGQSGAQSAADLSNDPAGEAAPPEATEAMARIGPGPHPVVRLDLGELGAIEVELYPEIAPNTVEHFLEVVESGFYDGTRFHRVIPGFMIQGGDPISKNPNPRRWGQGGLGRTIPDEFSDYPHLRGTLSMVNRGKPHTASSQFFIVHQDSRGLDGKYTAFGKVVKGLEVLDAVTQLERDQFGRYGPPLRPYPVYALLAKASVVSERELARAETPSEP